MQLAPRLDSVPSARRFLQITLNAWGLERLVDPVALAATELVTNAVRHARASFQLTLLLDGPITVAVADRGSGALPPAVPALADIDEFAESGRGLPLVAALADRWGVQQRPTGKTVWFQLETASKAAAPA